MPQDRQFVVRLTRPDHPEAEPDFVLLQVSPKGPRPLDIDLIGTEGETVFSVSCKVSTRSTGQVTPGLQFHALIRGLIKSPRSSKA